MVVAGDPSGDALAADLIKELDSAAPDPLRFIGAGGPRMAEAGATLEFDLTKEAVIGLPIRKLPLFWRRSNELVRLACQAQPELIVLVDFNAFNHRLAGALRRSATGQWKPKIAKYVSPQVWASRPGRAKKMARDFDLLLCLFPFEKEWYARRAPDLRVEFVGHPMFDKYGPVVPRPVGGATIVALLPGSRREELTRHLPVMIGAARQIHARHPSQFKMALPNEETAALAKSLLPQDAPQIEFLVGELAQALRTASLAISKTGTITLECAYFGVPTVALYKTSWLTYAIGRRIVNVKYLAMPNLLANNGVFPELIQGDATAGKVAAAALALLENPDRRRSIQSQLADIVASLGGSGASQRAASALAKLLEAEP